MLETQRLHVVQSFSSVRWPTKKLYCVGSVATGRGAGSGAWPGFAADSGAGFGDGGVAWICGRLRGGVAGSSPVSCGPPPPRRRRFRRDVLAAPAGRQISDKYPNNGQIHNREGYFNSF